MNFSKKTKQKSHLGEGFTFYIAKDEIKTYQLCHLKFFLMRKIYKVILSVIKLIWKNIERIRVYLIKIMKMNMVKEECILFFQSIF